MRKKASRFDDEQNFSFWFQFVQRTFLMDKWDQDKPHTHIQTQKHRWVRLRRANATISSEFSRAHFHQCSTYSFYARRSRKCKKILTT